MAAQARDPRWGREQEQRPTEGRAGRLRQRLFREHGINVRENDPLCLQYTMFGEVVEEVLTAAREEREQELEELRQVVQGVASSVALALEGAGKPVAKSLAETLNPQAIADRVLTELVDDLGRATYQVVRKTQWAVVCIGFLTTLLSFSLLFVAMERLDDARNAYRAAEALFVGNSDVGPQGPESSAYLAGGEE